MRQVRTLTVFRSLIIATYALAVIGALVDLVLPQLVPEPLNKAFEEHETFSEATWIPIAIGGLALLVADIVGGVAMFLLIWWGRGLSLWMTILTLLSTVFFGSVLYSGPAAAVLDTSVTLWGVVLGMAYFSDLKVHFDSVRSSAPASPA